MDVMRNRFSEIGPRVLGAIVLLLGVGAIYADDSKIDHGQSIRLTALAFEQQHLTHRALDDQVSAEWFEEFLRRLDPRRMYFLQADLEEFGEYANRLDDFARSGRFDFPQLVRDRYQLRVAQVLEYIEPLLVAQFDFGTEENVPFRYSEYAPDKVQLKERWRKRIKLEVLIETLHQRTTEDTTAQLLSRYRRIASQSREMSDERLCTIYLTALASRYDSRSLVVSDSFLVSLAQTISTYRFTLGLRVQPSDGRLVIDWIDPVISREAGSSAFIGWELLAISGTDGETQDVVELHPEDYLELVIFADGPLSKETHVTLELLHPVTLERRSVPWYRCRRSFE